MLAARRFAEGALYQANWHYRGKGISPDFVQNASFYLRTMAWSLGPVGAGLGLVGLVAALRERRAWAPILGYPLAVVGVLSTASVHWHRLVLSALGIAALLAGEGFEVLARRVPRAAWAIAAIAVLLPLRTSAGYVRDTALPGPRDEAVDWILDHVPAGARVLTTIYELGLDRDRVEVLEETARPGLDRRLAQDADLVVWNLPDRAPVDGFEVVWREKPRIGGGEFGEVREASLASERMAVILVRPGPALRSRYRSVPLAGAAVAASSNTADARLAIDGRLDTAWATQRSQDPGDWFEVMLRNPIRLGRVELRLGSMTKWKGESLKLAYTIDGLHWRTIPSAQGRAPVGEQLDAKSGGASQVLVTEALSVRGVRVRQTAGGDHRWGFAEIRIDELLPDSPE